jgi:hypothetical protein
MITKQYLLISIIKALLILPRIVYSQVNICDDQFFKGMSLNVTASDFTNDIKVLLPSGFVKSPDMTEVMSIFYKDDNSMTGFSLLVNDNDTRLMMHMKSRKI